LDSNANPDLEVTKDDKPRWNSANWRRRGFHNLHQTARYAISLRAASVLTLGKCIDRRIGDMPEVRRLTSTAMFSAMVVAREHEVLHEAYAPDFAPGQPHSIMSITKTHLNLVYGELIEAGLVDLDQTIGTYLPEIGSGYRDATVQQVLNMDVSNDYSEDYSDPQTSSYLHEVPMGWRLPADGSDVPTEHEFLVRISSAAVKNDSQHADYKSANSDVLGWLAERASGRPLRAFFANIADASGLAGAFHLTTDRDGRPWASGGGCLTARDLARYGLLFVRHGEGVGGCRVGSADFIDRTRAQPGKPLPPPRDFVRYSNQMNTAGPWIGHGGYGGQYMLCNMESGVVAVFLSVLENQDCYDREYTCEIIRMLADVAENA
jgi:CubicO group peptidase (beta-lactamase class C family)